jgi:hypothetical protein
MSVDSKIVKHVTVSYEDGSEKVYDKGAFVNVEDKGDDRVDVRIVFVNMTPDEAVDLMHCVSSGLDVIEE